MEGQGLQTVILHVTDCDRSPNLLSRDACYTLGVLKPCFNVENSTNSTESTHASKKDDLSSAFISSSENEGLWEETV